MNKKEGTPSAITYQIVFANFQIMGRSSQSVSCMCKITERRVTPLSILNHVEHAGFWTLCVTRANRALNIVEVITGNGTEVSEVINNIWCK